MPVYKKYLEDAGLWSEEQEVKLQADIRAIIDEGNEYAEKAAFQPVEDAFRYVYAEQSGEER